MIGASLRFDRTGKLADGDCNSGQGSEVADAEGDRSTVVGGESAGDTDVNLPEAGDGPRGGPGVLDGRVLSPYGNQRWLGEKSRERGAADNLAIDPAGVCLSGAGAVEDDDGTGSGWVGGRVDGGILVQDGALATARLIGGEERGVGGGRGDEGGSAASTVLDSNADGAFSVDGVGRDEGDLATSAIEHWGGDALDEDTGASGFGVEGRASGVHRAEGEFGGTEVSAVESGDGAGAEGAKAAGGAVGDRLARKVGAGGLDAKPEEGAAVGGLEVRAVRLEDGIEGGAGKAGVGGDADIQVLRIGPGVGDLDDEVTTGIDIGNVELDEDAPRISGTCRGQAVLRDAEGAAADHLPGSEIVAEDVAHAVDGAGGRAEGDLEIRDGDERRRGSGADCGAAEIEAGDEVTGTKVAEAIGGEVALGGDGRRGDEERAGLDSI